MVGAGIPQQDRADIGHESGGAGSVYEGNAVVAGVRLGDGGILAGGRPVKLAGVHDDAAQGGAVAADELGGGVDHDVRAVLDGADQIGRAEGVVDHQRQAVLVGDGRQWRRCRECQLLGLPRVSMIDGLGVGLDGAFHFRKIVDVHEGGGDAEAGQGVGQQVVAAAVNGLLGDDVVARSGPAPRCV